MDKMLIYPLDSLLYAHSKLLYICNYAGITIVRKMTDEFDFVMNYDYGLTLNQSLQFKELKKRYRVINGELKGHGKDYISEAFEEVFKYKILVDEGECYRKSIKQCTKDLISFNLIRGKEETGYVYQKKIEYCIDGKYRTLRIYICNSEVKFVLRRDCGDMMADNTYITPDKMTCPEKFIKPSDIKLINKFCKEIGLEWGELDGAYEDGDEKNKLYIFDVNNTPGVGQAFINSSTDMLRWFYLMYAYYFKLMI